MVRKTTKNPILFDNIPPTNIATNTIPVTVRCIKLFDLATFGKITLIDKNIFLIEASLKIKIKEY